MSSRTSVFNTRIYNKKRYHYSSNQSQIIHAFWVYLHSAAVRTTLRDFCTGSYYRACNFYRRHIKNFTYTSAILTDLIKNSTTWRWSPQ